MNLYKYLRDERNETVLSKQLLRSGTSIGANIAEVNLYIAFKECAESCHWLELLYTTDYLTKSEFSSINADCIELQKLLSSITKTLKTNS